MAPRKTRATRNSNKAKSHKVSVITDVVDTGGNSMDIGENIVNTNNPIATAKPLISEIPEAIMRLLRGSGHIMSNRVPLFDDDASKFNHWKNSFNHYLLVNDQHDHINKPNISDTENLALYLAIANCLQNQALNLIQTEAF